MAKCFTSNFANFRNLTEEQQKNCIAISATVPEWFKGDRWQEFAPPIDMVKSFKAGEISQNEYVLKYIKQLKTIDFSKYDFSDKILLCWCGKGVFCHRLYLQLFIVFKTDIEDVNEL